MTDAAENPMKLLLHACCGPCSLEPVRLLRERGVEPCLFYSNSNIHPAGEYEQRLDTIRTWADEERIAFSDGAYDPDAWEQTVGRIGDAAYERFGVIAGAVEDDRTHRHDAAKATEDAAGAGDDTGSDADAGTPGREGVPPLAHSPAAEQVRRARCHACYRMRLGEAARFASENGFDTLGTTLTVSPYQYTDVIREELERACANAGIRALFEDYRPFYPEATRRSRALGMYRQNYCGCRFSEEEAAVERAARKKARDAARAAEREAHAEERAAAEAALAAKRADRAAYQAKQARKHEILKSFRKQKGNVL